MTQRFAYFIGLVLVGRHLGTGFLFWSTNLGIMPCPFCTLQRICFGLTGIIFLIGCMAYRYRNRDYPAQPPYPVYFRHRHVPCRTPDLDSDAIQPPLATTVVLP